MPTLYRPETDKQRLIALSKAKRMAKVTPLNKLAFSEDTLISLNDFWPIFKDAYAARSLALSRQVGATGKLNKARRNLKMYIRHFFRVFNMAVARDLIKKEERARYSLDVYSKRLPKLNTDKDLQMRAMNIESGEASRLAAGGPPMAFPSAAEVADQLAIFMPLLADHIQKKREFDLAQEAVENLRKEADELLADIWDEVFFTYRKEEPPSLRRKARHYGVVYRDDE